MIAPKVIPAKNIFDNVYLLAVGRIEHKDGGDSEDLHDAARRMIESATESSLRDFYGDEYVDLTGIASQVETMFLDRNSFTQIKIAIECHSEKHLETVTERILLGWNILNGLSGTPYIGRCASKSETQAFLDPKWRGQL